MHTQGGGAVKKEKEREQNCHHIHVPKNYAGWPKSIQKNFKKYLRF